jgi:hypothetical protein
MVARTDCARIKSTISIARSSHHGFLFKLFVGGKGNQSNRRFFGGYAMTMPNPHMPGSSQAVGA